MKNKNRKKWFHAIGICGKTTSNVAKMFKDMGWFVTGSDIQYFPPASDFIKQNNIPHVQGYNYKHLTKEFWEEFLESNLAINSVPDLCLIVESISSKNKEYLFAKNKGIDVRPYAQILSEYLIKPESIVVTGTAGKTTTTALITKILKEVNLNPSYMIGAEVIDFKESLKNTDSNWSVMEGDEYHSKELSNGAKFLEYNPKYLIITNIGFEHQDVFLTQSDYTNEFAKAVQLIPKDGLVIAKAGDKNIDIAVQNSEAKVIRYSTLGSELTADYYIKQYFDVEDKANTFRIYDSSKKLLQIGSSTLIGDYNYENILSAYILCNEVPTLKSKVKDDLFTQIVKDFKGPKKRLERVYESEKLIVIDDFGVTPHRVKNSLKTLSEFFETKEQIVAVFEPNSASRPGDKQQFLQMYKDSFNNADLVVIPEMSEFDSELATSAQIKDWLKELGFNAVRVKSSEMINFLTEQYKNKKSLIAFFSSYRLTEIQQQFVQTLN